MLKRQNDNNKDRWREQVEHKNGVKLRVWGFVETKRETERGHQNSKTPSQIITTELHCCTHSGSFRSGLICPKLDAPSLDFHFTIYLFIKRK